MSDTASTPDFPSAGTVSVAPRLGSLLEEYGEISTILPVLAGLFFTSRLQLRGSQALLANLAIAAITRQIVIQLKQQATVSATPEKESAASPEPEDYTIVHSTLGRIRLRIPRLLRDASYAKRLEKLLAEDDCVRGVRLNRAAASVVLQYDGTGVSELELGMRLLQILDRAEKASEPIEMPTPTEF